MLQIHYFASVRESMQREGQQLPMPPSGCTVADLIALLTRTEPGFRAVNQTGRRLLVAVNQTLVERDRQLADNDEVAFFPPMTGG